MQLQETYSVQLHEVGWLKNYGDLTFLFLPECLKTNTNHFRVCVMWWNVILKRLYLRWMILEMVSWLHRVKKGSYFFFSFAIALNLALINFFFFLAFYIVIHGEVVVELGNGVNRSLHSGSYFGEIALVADSPRQVSPKKERKNQTSLSFC